MVQKTIVPKSVLGKGLASLLPNAGTPPPFNGGPGELGPSIQAPVDTGNRDRHPGIALVGVDEIAVNPYQPRREFEEEPLQELAQSIRSNGIIQPLVVRRTATGYALIAGERRLRASKIAGLKQVPVVIRRSTDREALELAVIENIQRENLNCIDEALAYHQLIEEFSLTQEEIAQRLGKKRETVANHLRLLRLSEAIVDDLKRGILSFGHGKALLSLEDPDKRLHARAAVVERGLSVRATEQLIDEMKRAYLDAVVSDQAPAPLASGPDNPIQARMRQLSLDMTRQFSVRVELKGGQRKGKIVFHYSSRQELERLLASLQNNGT